MGSTRHRERGRERGRERERKKERERKREGEREPETGRKKEREREGGRERERAPQLTNTGSMETPWKFLRKTTSAPRIRSVKTSSAAIVALSSCGLALRDATALSVNCVSQASSIQTRKPTNEQRRK